MKLRILMLALAGGALFAAATPSLAQTPMYRTQPMFDGQGYPLPVGPYYYSNGPYYSYYGAAVMPQTRSEWLQDRNASNGGGGGS